VVSGNFAARPAQELAIAAVQKINRLPGAERGHRWVRLVLAGNQKGLSSDGIDGVSPRLLVPQAEDVGSLSAMGHCDAVLAPQIISTVGLSSLIVAALAYGLPVIAANAGTAPDIITHEGRVAGTLLSLDPQSRVDVDELSDALLLYLREPEVQQLHRSAANSIFRDRFHIELAARACFDAYVAALDPLSSQRLREKADANPSEPHAYSSRQSA
jgi:glycosyltransferase involved in cell wall biosynthesis